ncbi:hypothetical protein NPIL_207461 [Nephila pilipes]|uniref:Histone-lysine N-methyltransferase SETMAR n=1 Tax=Nephila pilipes TaxID=299642 RepID=A0A8X6R0D1_NEPPI|nr:hypothetical protein NPIL_207461 [Nephila pilipes]
MYRMQLALVKRRGDLMFKNSAKPHVAVATTQHIHELDYECFHHPVYSSTPSDYLFFQHFSHYLSQKCFGNDLSIIRASADHMSETLYRYWLVLGNEAVFKKIPPLIGENDKAQLDPFNTFKSSRPGLPEDPWCRRSCRELRVTSEVLANVTSLSRMRVTRPIHLCSFYKMTNQKYSTKSSSKGSCE